MGHFGDPMWNFVAGYELMVCAGLAMYMMIATITNDLAGKTIMPFGKPWVKAGKQAKPSLGRTFTIASKEAITLSDNCIRYPQSKFYHYPL